MSYPRSFVLKPPRSLRLLACGLLFGAVFLCLLQPDRFGVLAAILLAGVACALWRATTACAGREFLILADGGWIPPGADLPHELCGSSTCLGGVLWLHGRREGGQRAYLMLTPDTLADEEAYRCVCVWYRTATSSVG